MRADPHAWYRGQEELDCAQRAVLPMKERAWRAATVQGAGGTTGRGKMSRKDARGLTSATSAVGLGALAPIPLGSPLGASSSQAQHQHQSWHRNAFVRHGCERLASLPPEDFAPPTSKDRAAAVG